MGRRGEDARARARRHRASVTLRSRTARVAVDEPEIRTGAWRLDVQPSQSPAPAQREAMPPASATLAPIPTRKPRRRRTDLDLTRLEGRVIAREAATVAVDAEVHRLRRLGAPWPQLAAAVGVSRQAARQRYGP